MPHFLGSRAQNIAIGEALHRKLLALFLSPGLGKTAAVLKTYHLLRKQGHARKRLLVIAPLRPCYSVWPREVKKWSFCQHYRLEILHGPGKLEALRRPADINVINPEGLHWLFKTALFRKRTIPWDVLAVDESGVFASPGSKRLKLLVPKLPKFTYRYILNGTPLPRSYLNLWSQMLIVDMGESLGTIPQRFYEAHFRKGGFKGKEWILREGEGPHITSKLAKHALILDVNDFATGLEPPLFTTRYFQLPPAAQQVYDSTERDLFVSLEEVEFECKNDGAKDTMLRQLASGRIYEPQPELARPIPTEQRKVHFVHDAKLTALLELVEELQGHPLLIIYDFRHSLHTLREALTKRFHFCPPFIGSGVSAKRGAEIERLWNTDRLPLLLLHPQSAAYGLNLQEGSGINLCWYDPTWRLSLYVQQYFRLWRRGVKGRVSVHHLIAENTVEEVMMARLGERAQQEIDFKLEVQRYWLRKYGKLLTREEKLTEDTLLDR